MSFEVILPFLRPIEHLIRDGEISEIMVNGSGRIYIEKHGELLPIPDASIPEKSLQVAVRNIARTLGDEVNDEHATPRCTPAGRFTSCRSDPAVLAPGDDPNHSQVPISTFHP